MPDTTSPPHPRLRPTSPRAMRAEPLLPPPDLARLLPFARARDEDPVARQADIVAKLERALRAERMRGRAGHSAYDLARHASLVLALRREKAQLARLARGRLADRPKEKGAPA